MNANIKVCFYTRNLYEKERIAQWLASTELIHCGIMISYENLSVVLSSDKSHYAKFIDSDAFHSRVMEPKYVIDLGNKEISLSQLERFMGSTYIGDGKSLGFWWVIGRYLFPNYHPKTCALITSQMLRICGYNVEDHVCPHTLFKELENANHNYRRTGWRREDNDGSHDC